MYEAVKAAVPEEKNVGSADFKIDNGKLTGYTGTDLCVKVPNGVIMIEKTAFSGKSGIVSVTLPDSVKVIADAAFSGCANLVEVNLNRGLLAIGTNAFIGCPKLAIIYVPASVRHIGGFAFNTSGKIEVLCEAKERPFGWVDTAFSASAGSSIRAKFDIKNA